MDIFVIKKKLEKFEGVEEALVEVEGVSPAEETYFLLFFFLVKPNGL